MQKVGSEAAWEELRAAARALAETLVRAAGLTGDEAERTATRITEGLIMGTADAVADVTEALRGPCGF